MIRVLAIAGAMLGVLLPSSCRPRPPAKETTAMQVRTDLQALRKMVNLPAGDFPCRWISAAASSGSAPGPTDQKVYGFISLDDAAWRALPAADTEESLQLRAAVARAVLPPSVLGSVRESDGYVAITGRSLPGDTLGRMPYRVGAALRIGDGLYVALHTM
jgi:hypothetical protein